MTRPDVIIENKIPFIKGLLEPICNVRYLAPEQITSQEMDSTDALITRTRTRCDASLLAGSRCRFIATATIGTDHIDLDYCRANGITVANAPGCNAPAVAQYVMSVVGNWLNATGRSAAGTVLGVVGVGHVGSIVVQWARANGLKTLCCDPPRAAEGDNSENFALLEQLAAECDIITFHTPMTRHGAYPTFHMAGKSFFSSLRRQPLLINSARGPVIDTPALIDALDAGLVGAASIDCWENEPKIDRRLLDQAYVATPHIAGYSLEGKKRATQMAVRALTSFFGLPEPAIADAAPSGWPSAPSLEAIMSSYNPAVDTAALRADATTFETLRNTYNYRPEVR